MVVHRPSSDRTGWAHANHGRRMASSCTPSVLSMILLIMAIITMIQVMIIVYSGRIHSDVNKGLSPRTAGYPPFVLDSKDQESKYSNVLNKQNRNILEQGGEDVQVSLPLSQSLDKPDTISNQSGVIQESLSNSSSTSTSYYYYYTTEANATSAVEDLQSSEVKDEAIPYKIVWLMSFPNSGTSYTMQAVEKYTRICTATNYEEESADPSPIPVYPDGPYWVHQTSNISSLPPPKSYILTKTHCDGYCNANKRCKVSKMHSTIMSLSNFQHGCLGIPIHHQSNITANNSTGSTTEDSAARSSLSYSPSLVFKAIHLVRDPLDNIVSRFHLAYKKLSKADQFIYTRDDVGFQRFCHFWDNWQISSTDSTSKGKKRKELLGKKNFTTPFLEIRLAWKQNETLTLSDVENVPCWADFFRYVNWHNNAFQVRTNMRLPTLTLYYEDYEEEDKWNVSMNTILQFLNQTKGDVKGKRGRVHPFKGGKGYHHYFTLEQRKAVWTFIEKISIPQTWLMLQRY